MKSRISTVPLCTLCCVFSGCSTLGLTLWPSQLPILSKAKEYANQSPIPSGMQHELAKRVVPEYYVEPGDRILVEPNQLDSDFEAVGDQQVKLDGSIDLGKFGRLRVAGMTVEGIENAVSQQVYSISQEWISINVQLIEANAAKVYVLGAVGSPGAYDLKGNETVLDAILLAGGLTSKASPCSILLTRPTDPCDCRVVQRICFRQITQLGDVSTNYQLQPGDRIVVGERTLCEELAFWKQAEACPCCDRSNCVQCEPETVNYRNRFTGWAAPLPLPEDRKQSAAILAEPASDSALPAKPNRPAIGTPPQDRPEDAEFFLPVPSESADEMLNPGANSPVPDQSKAAIMPAHALRFQ